MVYRPTFGSFIGSALYGMSPAIVAGIVLYFRWGNVPKVILIMSCGMGLLSLYFLIQAIFVHLNRLYLEGWGIGFAGPLARMAIPWADLKRATLFERTNAITRTDRMLILESPRLNITFNVSTLSPQDEREVLAIVGSKTVMVTKRHKPSV